MHCVIPAHALEGNLSRALFSFQAEWGLFFPARTAVLQDRVSPFYPCGV